MGVSFTFHKVRRNYFVTKFPGVVTHDFFRATSSVRVIKPPNIGAAATTAGLAAGRYDSSGPV